MKLSFSDDPALSERLFDLLDAVFPGIRQVAQTARVLGASWESVSTPFICFEGDRAVSHVGVIELSLILMGRTVTVGSIHGVATHPDYRRRGFFRQIMKDVLQYCASSYETLILTTEHPEYFQLFGFRVVGEHLFTVRCETPGGAAGFRIINPQDDSDVALLHRLLETREPVSNVVGVVNEKAVFCFNEGWRPLYYSADLDVIVCLELEGTRLKLFDIVGPAVPSLAVLLERIPQRLDEVAICFSPDRLEVKAEATPYLLDHDGPSYLMARGPFAAEGQAFTLPRSART
ncbi:MAG: GNAT family N-acetyltransferase [Acidobacteria bacterium]|nr:GNAT family N-acetyltransferase [Acidobacteriota bacterium]